MVTVIYSRNHNSGHYFSITCKDWLRNTEKGRGQHVWARLGKTQVLNYKERTFSEFSVNTEKRSGHLPRGHAYAEGPRDPTLLDLLQQVLT